MSPHAWWTLAVVVATIALLATERFQPALVVLGAVTALLVTGVVDARQAFEGFANEAPITIVALYVMAGAADTTGALEGVVSFALGTRPRTDSARRATAGELVRILVPSASMSAFIYNTPTVGMLAPRVEAWARRSGRSPSWYLMALNAAVLLGGLCTAIGTTTNVVVSGLLVQAHLHPMGLFEISRVGVPVAVAGLLLMLVAAPRLTTQRSGPTEQLEAERAFTVEMDVLADSPLAGKSVADAGLRNLEGVYLVEYQRDGASMAPVAPQEVLQGGDRLTFAGNVSRILDLQRIPGLVSAERPHFSLARANGRAAFEVVVGAASPLNGATLKEIGFRGRYGAAVLAIHRSGEPIPGKLGQVTLRAGDVLLVLGDTGFGERWRDRHDFLVIAPISGPPPILRRERARVVEAVMVGFVAVVGAGLLPVVNAALLAAGALIVLRVVTPDEARRAVDLDVVVLLAASFGLGEAMLRSGLAAHIATEFIRTFRGLGDAGIVAGVLTATFVVTQLVTNNAAAVLMFPIALAVASRTGIDARPLVMAVTVGASLSLLTPIGYQTNMMVAGIAGYRFRDFAVFGLPVSVVTLVVAALVIPVAFPLHVHHAASAAVAHLGRSR